MSKGFWFTSGGVEICASHQAVDAREHLVETAFIVCRCSAGHATTFTEAVKMSEEQEFDLVLADIQLADGSSGIDAVEEIRRSHEVEVIFITAFPERLMSGEGREPAFLIPKPFKSSYVKAMVSQALLTRERRT